MKEALKAGIKTLIITIGVLFVLFGILGLFLPFLQGILFLLIGFLILSRHSKRVEKWEGALRGRYPRLNRFMGRINAWEEKYLPKFLKKRI